MKMNPNTPSATLPAPTTPRRRVRSLTLTVRWADEPPTLDEVVEDLRAAADRLAARQTAGGRTPHEA